MPTGQAGLHTYHRSMQCKEDYRAGCDVDWRLDTWYGHWTEWRGEAWKDSKKVRWGGEKLSRVAGCPRLAVCEHAAIEIRKVAVKNIVWDSVPVELSSQTECFSLVFWFLSEACPDDIFHSFSDSHQKIVTRSKTQLSLVVLVRRERVEWPDIYSTHLKVMP